MRTIQCFRRAVLSVDRLLAYVFIEWSRTARSLGATDWKSVVQGDQNANSLPRQATAFLRVQTSDSTKDLIEIKLPSGISILVPVSAVESISAILEQVT